MSTVRELSEQLILEHAKPLLKSHGYRKSRWVWSKTDGEITRLLSVTFSKYNSASESRYMINMDVCNQQARAAVGQEPAVEWMPGSGIPGHVRVAEAVGGPPFWSVTPAVGVTAEHHESLHDTIVSAVDWLETFRSLRDSYDYLVKVERWLLAVPLGLALGVPEAEDMLRRTHAEAQYKKNADYMVRLADRYGIEIS